MKNIPERNLIPQMYQEGMSLSQISGRVGLTPGAVRSYLVNRGIQMRQSQEGAMMQGHTKSNIDREKLPETYASGLSVRQIADQVGLSMGAVYSILKVRGAQFRHQTESKKIKSERYQQQREIVKREQFLVDQAKRVESESRGWSNFQTLNDEALLRDKLSIMPATELAAQIGCSGNSVLKAARKYGIDLPFAVSEYQRQRTVECNIGNTNSLGTKRTPEQRARMSAASMGKRGTNLGRKFSEEHKEKLRQANLGKKHNISPEGKERMLAARAAQVLPVQDTFIERLLQIELAKRGVQFETHKALPGLPDIFIEPNVCVFADGDYWHSRPEAIKKDEKISGELIGMGYNVIRIREKDIKRSPEECVDRILERTNTLEEEVTQAQGGSSI